MSCLLATALVYAGLSSGVASGAIVTYTWTGGTSADWSTSGNWSGGVPATNGAYTDAVRINRTATSGAVLTYSAAQSYTNYVSTTSGTRVFLISAGDMAITGGTLDCESDLGDAIGNSTSASNLTISGGAYINTKTDGTGIFSLKYNNSGLATLNITGGLFEVDTLRFGGTSSATSVKGDAVLNLTGGTLASSTVYKSGSSAASAHLTSIFNWDGGTFQALSNGTTLGGITTSP